MKKRMGVGIEIVNADGTVLKKNFTMIDFVIEAMRIIPKMMDGEIIKAEFVLCLVESKY